MDGLLGVAWDNAGWPVGVELCWRRKWVDEWEEDEGDEDESSSEVPGDERDRGLVVACELSLMFERPSVINVVEEVLKAEEMDGVDV